MPEVNRLKSLLGEVKKEEEQAQVSRLKSLVPEKPSARSDFMEGVATPFRNLATMVSGDPEKRGLPPVPEAPNSLAGRIGNAAAESALIAVPVGRAASGITKGVEGATGIANTLRNITSEIGAGFTKSPTRFLAAEAGLGGASGAGGYFAEQKFPDSDAARFIGEIAGGLAPSAVGAITGAAGRTALTGADKLTDIMPGTAAAKTYLKNTWNDVARTVNAQTAGGRASERFQRATGGQSPEQIIGSMGADVMPEARALLTPAQLSNNPGLLSLERSIINETDNLRNKSAEQLASLNNVILQGLKSPVSEQAARTGLDAAQKGYNALLNQRVQLAALKAEEGIQRMIPELGAEGANKIAARELGKALEDARKQESELFGKIDLKAVAPTSNVRSELSRLTREAGKAGAGSIPDYAKNLFTRQGRSFLGSTSSVNELRQAQSQLRTIARNKRVGADPDLNAARIADRLADAITDDLAMAQGDNPQAIKDAVDFSRAKNQTFRQGMVGKILRTASDNGDVVPEALTLEASLGLGGARGAQAYDELVAASSFMQGQPTPEMARAMDSYVKNEFLRSSTRDGKVSPASAQTFMRNNEGLLNRFPQIKADIQQAIESGSSLKAAEDLRKGGMSTFSDPNVSKAAIFMNKGPVAAFDAVLSSRSARQETRKLVDLVSRDETGEALQGLKSGFMDYLIDKSTTNGVISGEKLSDIASSKGLGVIDTLFDKEEKNRLFQIIRTAQRADAARAAKPSAEGISGDKISSSANMLLGIMGAAYGGRVSTNLGGGEIQIASMFANKFRQLGVSGLINPARRLIVDAMQDEKLFKQVLMAKDPEHPTKEATRLFNAWALGALAREANQEEEQQ